MNKKAGFTLVEIIVVVAVIGILAAFLIPNMNQGTAQARDAERRTTLVTVQGAIELYKNKYGRYPAACNPASVSSSTNSHWEGTFSGERGTDYECSDGSANYIRGLAPEFIPVLPKDPFRDGLTNRSYVYVTNPHGTVYKFMSINGRETDPEVDYLSPLARCGDLNLGTGDSGNECAAIPSTPLGGYSGYNLDTSGNNSFNTRCRESHSQFDSTFAVWGGYAPGGQRGAVVYLETEKAREFYSDVIRCK